MGVILERTGETDLISLSLCIAEILAVSLAAKYCIDY